MTFHTMGAIPFADLPGWCYGIAQLTIHYEQYEQKFIFCLAS